jgi:uroporphyrinogen decarboxylase
VATYMAEGGGSPDQRAARLWAYRDPAGFGRLVEMLVEASVDYLAMQAEAGADVLQIFDTWAGSLPPREFETWVVEPTRRIVAVLRAKHPQVPIIGFPRGVGRKIGRYVTETGVQGVGCDTGIDVEHMRSLAGSGQVAVQGNLDPMALIVGGEALRAQTEALLEGLAGVPHIFNLGHGILPETPVEHVAWLVERVRGQTRS